MKRAIAKIALGVFVSFSGLGYAGYYGGQLKNHGHTAAAGDGGPLANPVITGTITPAKVNTSTITAQQMTVTTLIMPSTGTATLGQVTNFNGGPIGMFRNKIVNGTFDLDSKYNRTSHTITVSDTRHFLADNWTASCSNTGAGQYNLQTFLVNLSSYPFTTYAQAQVNGACDVTGANRLGELRTTIDGKNAKDFMFGTSSAASVTLSFYVLNDYSGGRMGVSLCNASQTRCYTSDYPSTSSGLWTRNTITIPGDTAGSWTGSDSTMTVRFDIGSGATYVVGSSSWAASSANHLSGDVVYCDGGGGSVFKISGVQLETSSTTTTYEKHPPQLDTLLTPKLNTFGESQTGAYQEFVSSSVTNATVGPANGVYGDIAVSSVTAGEWLCSGFAEIVANGATWTGMRIGVIPASPGTGSTGIADGLTSAQNLWASSATTPLQETITIPPQYIAVTTLTGIYLKVRTNFTAGGPPTYVGTVSCIRTKAAP